jgi:hypothetical protein
MPDAEQGSHNAAQQQWAESFEIAESTVID